MPISKAIKAAIVKKVARSLNKSLKKGKPTIVSRAPTKVEGHAEAQRIFNRRIHKRITHKEVDEANKKGLGRNKGNAYVTRARNKVASGVKSYRGIEEGYKKERGAVHRKTQRKYLALEKGMEAEILRKHTGRVKEIRKRLKKKKTKKIKRRATEAAIGIGAAGALEYARRKKK